MKIGILGAGRIAVTLAETMNKMPEVECYGVASRDLEKAKVFAKEHGFQHAFGSYEGMLADEEVELIYIATPHSHHYRHMKMCLDAGKHILCEKSFTVNEKQAEEIFRIAKEKKLLVTEAIWTRYMPSRKIIEEIIQSGELGKIYTVSANLGYPVFMNERMFRPELGGGALLDLTVYPLNFASMFLGNDIRGISASCILDDHGVDGQNQVMMAYSDGKMASLFASMFTLTDRAGWIYGEKGNLEVQNINNPEAIRLYRHNKENVPFLEKEYSVPPQINGYEYEVISCALAIRNGKCECEEMPHSETLEIMRQMDRIRKVWKTY